MAGIVTIEDLLEELVGEIFSEHVKNVLPTVMPMRMKMQPRVFLTTTFLKDSGELVAANFTGK